VTRYFGGTKLGTGGLVRAYSGAAKDALSALPTTLKIEKRYLGISIPYSFYERLKMVLTEHHADIDNEEFDAEVTVYAYVPVDQLDSLNTAVLNLTAGQAAPILLDGSS